jgi:hypothetical protein
MTRLNEIQLLFIILVPVLSYGQKEKLTLGLNSGVNISYLDDYYSKGNLFWGYSIGAKARLNPQTSLGMKNSHSLKWYIETGINYIYQGYTYTIYKQTISLTQRQF